MSIIKVAVFGAAGQMGKKNMAAVLAANFTLSGAIDRKESLDFGKDVGTLLNGSPLGITITDDIEKVFQEADVLIDFSAPVATLSYLPLAIKHRTALVIGTTGFTKDQLSILEKTAEQIPVVFSGNYSTGVNTLLGLARQGAKALGIEFDIEMVEHHHKRKVDSPSGTAIMLAKALCEGRGFNYDESVVTGRAGQCGPRTPSEIGVMAVRGGGTIGKHSIYFVSENETIEMTHSAHNREAFTSGVVKAVAFLEGKKSGYFSMLDVLGLS